MGKKPAVTKYGSPLYGAVWPQGDYAFVGGGGGKKSSGIPNRVIIIQDRHGELSSDITGQAVARDAPLRMALHPQSNALLLALGNGSLQRFDIALQQNAPPSVMPASERVDKLLGRFERVRCLSFSSDGRLLALGHEDASISIVDWISLRTLIEIRGLGDVVRDMDFSRAHKDKLLATTCEDGSCLLWAWEKQLQIATLDLPPGYQGFAFNRCRFARDGTASLYTTLNGKGETHVLHWEQNEEGELLLKRRLKAYSSPSTAFEISRTGKYLGMGTAEGDAVVISTATLEPVQRTRAAHMVFATAVAFKSDESALLSVSADASARLTLISPLVGRRTSLAAALIRLLLLLVLLVCLLLAGAWYFGLDTRLLEMLKQYGFQPGKHSEL